jgi:hypothetical protein
MMPKKFLESGLAQSKGATLFGVEFTDMTRDELIAAAVRGWRSAEQRSHAVHWLPDAHNYREAPEVDWRGALAYVISEADGWHDDCRGGPVDTPEMTAARELLK